MRLTATERAAIRIPELAAASSSSVVVSSTKVVLLLILVVMMIVTPAVASIDETPATVVIPVPVIVLQ